MVTGTFPRQVARILHLRALLPPTRPANPTLRNPGFNNHDIAIAKRLPISQEQSVELMLQGFNFMNHGNWNDPDVEIGPEAARNANAGRIIGSRGGRVLQLGLRYNF